MPGTTWRGCRRRNITRLLRVAAWALLAGVIAPTPAAATLYLWQGPNAGGVWTDAANWFPNTGYPNAATDIALISSQTGAIAIAIPATTAEITLQQLLLNGTDPIAIVGVNSTLVLSGLASRGIEVHSPGTNTIQIPVRLDANTAVLVPAATVVFQLGINESGGSRAFTKQGAGTVVFADGNTYTGTTTIEAGILRLIQPNAIANAAKIDVRSGAKLEAQQEETIGNLTITDGVVELSGSASLSVSSLTMTGGIITAVGIGVQALSLSGNVTATSSATQAARIATGVQLNLTNASRTFTVNDGPQASDLEIQASLVATPGATTVGLIKDGAGPLFYGGNGSSIYLGPTWVKQGRILLFRKLAGDARVGDGIGPAGEAVLLAGTSNLIEDQRSVIVEADGLYDLGEQDETLDQLTINGGKMTPGVHIGVLSLRSLVMNGGTLEIGAIAGLASLVRMRNVQNVRIEATSAATQTPIIRGDGLLVLDGSPDVIVHDGPQPIDLKIDVGIVSGAGKGFTKSGPGVAQLTFNNTYPGPTTVAAGTLLIDGSQPISTMNVNGGTLGGTGFTGNITGGAAGAIAPGHSPGILNSGSLTLAAGVTFAPELNGTTAGSGYDQLKVHGTVALANATLTLAIGANVTLPQNANLTIIDNDGADAVTGTFANLAEGATVIGDRHVFLVSYHGGDGNDVVLTVTTATEPQPEPTPGAVTYYLAEGATGGFFDEDVAIANPTDTDAPVTLTFLQEGGGTVVGHRTVPKQARLTVHVDQIAGLENASPSVQVESDQKVPLIVERSMFWDSSYYGGHTANAVAKPETKWILAEGFQGFFDTYLLIANANASETTATVTFLRENDTPVVKTIPIAAFARKTIYAGEFSELIGRAFGMVVEATQPVIAERSMYFASIPGRLWTGGHVNTGVNAPSTSWFHAEGATGGFFNTFILLSNPQTSDAHVDLRFLLEDGTSIVKSKTLPAGQRLTVNPAAEGEPRLENAALSTVVASDVPIVSERSMYWPGDATPFGEGHNSSGVVATATRWGIAEGRVGAPRNFTTYILLANPTTTAAEVTVTYLRESGAPVTKTYTVPPTSRFNIDVAGAVPELHDESFGARIEVTNGVAIAVERSLYWDANGIFWAGGTNALGTPLP